MKTVFVILALVSCAAAHGDGAPVTACVSMLPTHVDGVLQDSVSPYSLVVTEKETEDNSVDVTIIAPLGQNFAGFFLQARNSDDVPVGTFVVEDATAQVMTCPGGENNAVTQTSTVAKQRVAVTWTPPEADMKTTFKLTILKDKVTIWAGQSVTIGAASGMKVSVLLLCTLLALQRFYA